MLAPLAIVLVNNLKNTHNKQFNSDSQRLALSLRVELSVYGAVFKFSVCAAHTLIGRYESPRFQRYKIKRLGYGKRKKDRTTSSGFN